MTRIEISEPALAEMIAEEVRTWVGKGDEYTIGNPDRLYNFTSIAKELGVTPLQVWCVYFLKHVYSVLAYAKTGKEGMESIEGRLLDIAVYAKLGRLIVRSMQPQGFTVGPIEVSLRNANQLEFDFSDSYDEWK